MKLDDSQGVGVDDKAEAAKQLATRHYQVEAGMTQIFRITGSAEVELNRAEPIKLLEVNEDTVSAGIMPLHFGSEPASGIRFPSIIIEVTPGELERIRSSELELPKGWENWEEVPKPTDHPGGA